MGKYIDETGNKYGRWAVVSYAGKSHWACTCECGTERVVDAWNLRKGQSASCGCLKTELQTTHGMSQTRTYHIWEAMIQRTTNPNHVEWEDYGGRGITIKDPRWFTFADFYSDMGEKPEGLSLDRKDNDRGYYKDNCHWATPTEQLKNRRKFGTSSKYRGVSWHKAGKKWAAEARLHKGKRVFSGLFTKEIDAAVARDLAVIKFKTGNVLNFPDLAVAA